MSARRRHPLAGYAVVLFALLLTGIVYAVVSQAGDASASPAKVTPSALVQEGKAIFSVTCAACHGDFGQGTPGVAPSLIGVGAAAVNFQTRVVVNAKVRHTMPSFHLPAMVSTSMTVFLITGTDTLTC